MSNILITGGNGQLGTTFKSLLLHNKDYNYILTSSHELDITNHKSVRKFVAAQKIDVLINCAAYTNVNRAEIDQNQANATNNLAVSNLAQVCKDKGVKFIHISTDYVFDGKSKKPYVESDSTGPQTYYGKTKLKGEIAIRNINPKNSIIIRTSWLFSTYGKNFVIKMIKLANEKKQINVVSNQIGSPTNAKDLARIILKIIPKIKNKNVELFHFANTGSCSWYDFAKEIFKQKKINTILVPISSDDYESEVNRPNFSVLSSEKIQTKYKIAIPSWIDALKENFNLNNE